MNLDREQQAVVVGGKTLREWGEYLTFPIPRDMDPASYYKAQAELSERLGVIYRYLAPEIARRNLAKHRRNKARQRALQALVADYEERGVRRPPRDVLVQLADRQIENVVQTYTFSQIKVAFWKEWANYLEFQSDMLRSRSYVMNLETKIS